VLPVDKDRYGRVVAEIYKGETWINLELVKRGMAWVYLQYSRDPMLLAAESEARRARTGLWRDREPVAPWEWRKR
jgi:endonuclease YncB( thermonuclease family)